MGLPQHSETLVQDSCRFWHTGLGVQLGDVQRQSVQDPTEGLVEEPD